MSKRWRHFNFGWTIPTASSKVILQLWFSACHRFIDSPPLKTNHNTPPWWCLHSNLCLCGISAGLSQTLSLSLSLQQTKERVKLLIQLADGFCEKGHAHASEIQKWVASVDKRYRDFSLRMDKYRSCLEKALGLSTDSNKAVRGLWEWVCWYGLHGWSVDEQYLCCKSR